MNFLAHFCIAVQRLPPGKPLPAYVMGTALPDLLPLAAERVRLRPAQLEQTTARNEFEAALSAGVSVHLATDAAFHKTQAFTGAQAEISRLITEARFEGMRVRRFFVAHVLTELVLDAVLLRRDPALADRFYGAFAAAEFEWATCWTEAVTGKPLPRLPSVLTRFAEAQYLRHYAEDDGVVTGLSHLCRRAGQDMFEGGNYARLLGVAAQAAARMPDYVPVLLAETAEGICRESGEHDSDLQEVRVRT